MLKSAPLFYTTELKEKSLAVPSSQACQNITAILFAWIDELVIPFLLKNVSEEMTSSGPLNGFRKFLCYSEVIYLNLLIK